MNGLGGPVDRVLDHSRIVVVLMLLLTAAIGAGASMVEQSSSLEQFQSDSPEAEKLDYVEANFTAGEANTTRVQVIVRDGNVLDRQTLLGILAYQQALADDDRVSPTLVEGQASASVATVLATAAIRREEAADVQRVAAEFRQLNASISQQQAELSARNRTLSTTAEALRGQLTFLRQNRNASVDAAFDRVRANTTVELDDADRETFRRAARQLRNATDQQAVEEAYRLGSRGVLAEEYEDLEMRYDQLSERLDHLRVLADDLEAERAELAAAANASLADQHAQLESMNASELDAVIGVVLGEGGDGRVFAFMPTGFEPGTTEAEATMVVVTQRSASQAVPGGISEAVTDAQLAMQELAGGADGGRYVVFGPGIIFEEIDSSMTDSLLIVGPLALLFVVVALAVAYRDLLDILLGVAGIGAVLTWTFGFMGWADIAFNQMFVAVPVLLIGLSIDYAIHIFMRHREERAARPEGAPPDARAGSDTTRGSMRTALAGVGIALVYVTATTVIGFLSNLTSPVPPIREFGVVSAFGIVAALAVFGLLVPALKVELDELLEGWGLDRHKRAFGTGGGAFSSVLSAGATGARKAPAVVIVLALVLSVGGAYGATQVDTSFDQADFLAEEPPAWTERLPEPFAPGEYTAKANLEYVNENFLREDTQAQILVEGDVATPRAMEQLAAARAAAADKHVTQTLSNGEARIRGPLSVMRQVAATDESFNATFTAADTDGDGVPDRDVAAVYDALFAAAPVEAAGVIHRDGDEYRAVRMVVSVRGAAPLDRTTDQMRDVADGVAGAGLTATATGSTILNDIVQDELLTTVIQSLVITLVATFLFLMATYRITEGSATLGAVTLLPVALSVAWILGTMYLLDIPFNVLTGMITSLTVGLGVAYSIHLSERYNQELRRTGDVWEAMQRATTGTGGALLGSAATTVGGFGVLVFAILPPLQQFGIITGLTIVYAFLAAVLVLPSLLVVWTRLVGPGGAVTGFEAEMEDHEPGATAPEDD